MEKNNAMDNLSRLLDEIIRKGITFSSEQSEILWQDYGIDIPPHILAEYKYHESKKPSITPLQLFTTNTNGMCAKCGCLRRVRGLHIEGGTFS